MPRSRGGTHAADMATDGPFGAQSLVFDDGQNGENQYKVKMGKINTFYGLPNQPLFVFARLQTRSAADSWEQI